MFVPPSVVPVKCEETDGAWEPLTRWTVQMLSNFWGMELTAPGCSSDNQLRTRELHVASEICHISMTARGLLPLVSWRIFAGIFGLFPTRSAYSPPYTFEHARAGFKCRNSCDLCRVKMFRYILKVVTLYQSTSSYLLQLLVRMMHCHRRYSRLPCAAWKYRQGWESSHPMTGLTEDISHHVDTNHG